MSVPRPASPFPPSTVPVVLSGVSTGSPLLKTTPESVGVPVVTTGVPVVTTGVPVVTTVFLMSASEGSPGAPPAPESVVSGGVPVVFGGVPVVSPSLSSSKNSSNSAIVSGSVSVFNASSISAISTLLSSSPPPPPESSGSSIGDTKTPSSDIMVVSSCVSLFMTVPSDNSTFRPMEKSAC